MGYGDSKKIIHLEPGERGMLVEHGMDGTTRNYYPNLWTIWLYCDELQIVQTAAKANDKAVEKIQTSVSGKARLVSDYGFSVIGDAANKTKIIEVCFSELEKKAGAPEYDEDKDDNELDMDKYGAAHLYFAMADWEIGTNDSWWLGCYVEPEILKVLRDAVTNKKLEWLSFGVQLKGLYSDESEYSPVSIRRNFYLRPRKNDNDANWPESSHGFLSSFTLGCETMSLVKPRLPREDQEPVLPEEQEIEVKPEYPSINQITMPTFDMEPLRRTIKWVGGLITLALFLLVFK
jgi:hypothetical protein